MLTRAPSTKAQCFPHPTLHHYPDRQRPEDRQQALIKEEGLCLVGENLYASGQDQP